ncbi:hypothetical protein WA026_002163 [Henosepilachna vigintioctopunctata]|uniref:Uncharacterized protein n=1 Tax=Henosepilachna vigintioctopunctata TaxID=420089 RepID=A0AAW1TZL3_9CUCU
MWLKFLSNLIIVVLLMAVAINPIHGGGGHKQHSERGPFGGGSKPSHGASKLGGGNNNIGRGGNRRF